MVYSDAGNTVFYYARRQGQIHDALHPPPETRAIGPSLYWLIASAILKSRRRTIINFTYSTAIK